MSKLAAMEGLNYPAINEHRWNPRKWDHKTEKQIIGNKLKSGFSTVKANDFKTVLKAIKTGDQSSRKKYRNVL